MASVFIGDSTAHKHTNADNKTNNKDTIMFFYKLFLILSPPYIHIVYKKAENVAKKGGKNPAAHKNYFSTQPQALPTARFH